MRGLWQRVYDREFERIMAGGATGAEIAELNEDRDENPITEAEQVTELEARWLAKDAADRWHDDRVNMGYQAAKDRDV